MELFTLETARLRLRPLTLADAPRLHELFDTDPEVWRFDPGYARTLDERVEVIASYIEQYQTHGFGFFAVERRSDGILMGQCGLTPHAFEGRDGTVTTEFEVMYKLGRLFWNQGYATEAAQRWIDYGFAIAGLGRLVVCPDRGNSASLRVLEKLGFRMEDDWLVPGSILAFLENPGGILAP